MLAKRLLMSTRPLGTSYWLATLSSTAHDQGQAVVVDSAGNVFVAAITNSAGGSGGMDALVAKYDKNGALSWQRGLGGSGAEYCQAVALDAGGNLLACGYTASQGAGDSDGLLVKYDTAGNLLWQRLLGDAGNNRWDAVSCDASSNVYVVGGTDLDAGSVLLAKYNSSGTLLWQRALSSPNYDVGKGVAADTSGNVYVVGDDQVAGNGMVIAKYDTNGSLLWQRRLAGGEGGAGEDIAVDTSGNVYVAGRSNTRSLIVKYDSSGVLQWQRGLATTNFGAKSVAVDASGNVIVGGVTNFVRTTNQEDGFVAKYNASGTLQWQRYIYSAGAGNDWVTGVATDANGDVYAVGYFAGTLTDIFLAKLPGDGTRQGVYGSLTYEASGMTASTATQAEAANSMTSSTPTLTGATSTLTSTARNLTSSTTRL